MKRHQIGVYAQDQLRFRDGWIVTLNGRYDYVTTKAVGTPAYDASDASPSGRAGIAYEFENGITPYASIATFFSPEIGSDSNGDFLKPETGQQYEIGLKYRPTIFDGIITASLFDLTKENVLTGPSTSQYQVGKVNSRGIEVEAQVNINEAWKVAAAFTALEMEIKEDADASLIGKWPYLIPDMQASIFAHYTFLQGRLKGFTVGGGVRYVGSSYADAANTLKVPDVTLVDVKVGFKKNNWGIDLNITNLFDKEYVSGCQGLYVCSYGEGRKGLLKAHFSW